jgi:hypothetical protein
VLERSRRSYKASGRLQPNGPLILQKPRYFVHEPVAPQHITMDSVIFYQPPTITDGPPREAFQQSISAINQSQDRLDTLTDNGDELPSFMDILSRARSVAPRAASQTTDLTIDASDDVS